MSDTKKAEHFRACSSIERDAFRGSKYIQSNLGDVFLQVKSDLENSLLVMFSGTPCQISGLIHYLISTNTKKMENLITVDIACHGVSSPGLWAKYITWLDRRLGSVTRIEFRNKINFGWREHKESIWVGEKRHDRGTFAKMFTSKLSIRPSCYHCPYKSPESYSDIRIADAWGIEKNLPEWNDDKGASLVILQTAKGTDLFQESIKNIEYSIADFAQYMQPAFKGNFAIPEKRKKFWKDYRKLPFGLFVFKYGGTGIRKLLKKLVK